jgi:branched-chain amino acid transport system substrate-binding protein
VSQLCEAAPATKKYGPGVTDKEIKIGNIMPYSGPASAYGPTGTTQAAYYRMVNERGGINGRKINFITLDGAMNPAKTVELARRLIERENVLLLSGCVGTAPNAAIHKYTNARRVPNLFISSGATNWDDPVNFPWTLGFQPAYEAEARLYAEHILQHSPRARIGILYQNDDYGKDYVRGLRHALGARAGMVVAELSYEITAPTVDSQILQLKGSGADVFFNVCSPKFAAQAIRKVYDIGWRPVHYLNTVATSVASVLEPAGLNKCAGIISASFLKDPTSAEWDNDSGVAEWRAFMAKYYPEGDVRDRGTVYGATLAQALVHVLTQAGDNLTRENIMKVAASLRGIQLPLALPGVLLETSATDFRALGGLRMQRFEGRGWVPIGEVVDR